MVPTAPPGTTLPNTNLRSAELAVSGPAITAWTIETTGHLDPDALDDVLILLKYKLQSQ
jgi:hypothetical protein